jgi:hypothetical protein
MNTANRYFISRAAEALLEARTLKELSSDELITLLKSYNAVGATKESFVATCMAIQLFPSNMDLLRWHRDISYAWLDEADVAREFRRCRAERIGPAAFWHLAMADYHLLKAWGNDEHMLGLPEDPGSLVLAAQELEADEVATFQSETMLAAVPACRKKPSTNGSMGFFVLSVMRTCGEPPKTLTRPESIEICDIKLAHPFQVKRRLKSFNMALS